MWHSVIEQLNSNHKNWNDQRHDLMTRHNIVQFDHNIILLWWFWVSNKILTHNMAILSSSFSSNHLKWRKYIFHFGLLQLLHLNYHSRTWNNNPHGMKSLVVQRCSQIQYKWDYVKRNALHVWDQFPQYNSCWTNSRSPMLFPNITSLQILTTCCTIVNHAFTFVTLVSTYL